MSFITPNSTLADFPYENFNKRCLIIIFYITLFAYSHTFTVNFHNLLYPHPFSLLTIPLRTNVIITKIRSVGNF